MAIPENPITRKEHFLAKAAGESVNTPEPITREEMYLDAIASGSGGGGGADNRFVVTLTPTKPDYSGTTDKTYGEVYNAYISGKEIWARLVNRDAMCTFVEITGGNRVKLVAYVILDGENMLILAKINGTAGDKTNALYTTTIYQLTPMGG
jgi:hypothetical protein